jgi:hypothetical protein
VPRGFLCATSLTGQALALFAGGLKDPGADEQSGFDFVPETCRLAAFHAFRSLAGYSKAVDIFNGFTSAWSTAKLSVARSDLAATSLPALGLAFFAGGESDSGLVLFFIVRLAWPCLLPCFLSPRLIGSMPPLITHPSKQDTPKPSTYSTASQVRGQQLNSASRAPTLLQLRFLLSGWPSSPGAIMKTVCSRSQLGCRPLHFIQDDSASLLQAPPMSSTYSTRRRVPGAQRGSAQRALTCRRRRCHTSDSRFSQAVVSLYHRQYLFKIAHALANFECFCSCAVRLRRVFVRRRFQLNPRILVDPPNRLLVPRPLLCVPSCSAAAFFRRWFATGFLF